jgi:hypothetical protein
MMRKTSKYAGSLYLKTKITVVNRDSCAKKEGERTRSVLGGFRQCPDAVSAQGLANQPPIFQDRDFLEVRAKGPASSAQRKAAVVPKGCGFATMIALSHLSGSFHTP